MGQSQGSSGKGQKPATPSYGSMGGGKNTSMSQPNQNMMGQRKPMGQSYGNNMQTTTTGPGGTGMAGPTPAAGGAGTWGVGSGKTFNQDMFNAMRDDYSLGGNRSAVAMSGLDDATRAQMANYYGPGGGGWGDMLKATSMGPRAGRSFHVDGLPDEMGQVFGGTDFDYTKGTPMPGSADAAAPTAPTPATPAAPVDPNAAVPMQKRRVARTRAANPQALAQMMQRGF